MKFTSSEVRELVWESEVETEEGENRRWSRTNTSIVEDKGKYYEVYWEEGLTENQENEYFAQDAPEVVKVSKVIPARRVDVWERKEDN